MRLPSGTTNPKPPRYKCADDFTIDVFQNLHQRALRGVRADRFRQPAQLPDPRAEAAASGAVSETSRRRHHPASGTQTILVTYDPPCDQILLTRQYPSRRLRITCPSLSIACSRRRSASKSSSLVPDQHLRQSIPAQWCAEAGKLLHYVFSTGYGFVVLFPANPVRIFSRLLPGWDGLPQLSFLNKLVRFRIVRLEKVFCPITTLFMSP